MRVLVTGASGFVGSVLCQVLADAGWRVRAASRTTDSPLPAGAVEKVIVGDLSAATDWTRALADVDSVIHLAARVHVMNDRGGSSPYVESNAEGTRHLARTCAAAGVRRFLFVSTIKVNGEESGSRTFTARDVPCPKDAYGSSKWLAEQYLMEVASGTGLEAVIARPPLMYGPGVRANFLRLLRWVDDERPLPFGAIRNRRSLLSVWNFSDFLASALRHPAAAGKVWLVSDGEDLSTPELIERLARHMGRRLRLFGVPVPLLRTIGLIGGRRAEVQRLCSSLSVDIDPLRAELGWTPRLTLDEGLARTVTWYLREGRSAAARNRAGDPPG